MNDSRYLPDYIMWKQFFYGRNWRNIERTKEISISPQKRGIRWGVTLKIEFIVLTCGGDSNYTRWNLRYFVSTFLHYKKPSILIDIEKVPTFIVCDYESRMNLIRLQSQRAILFIRLGCVKCEMLSKQKKKKLNVP